MILKYGKTAGRRLNLKVLISLFIFSVPIFTAAYVYEKGRSLSIVSAEELEFKVNGRKATGRVHLIKGTAEEALAHFRREFNAAGYLETATKRNTAEFRGNGKTRALNIISEGNFCSALVYESVDEPYIAKRTGVEGRDAPGVPSPPGGIREFCLERSSGREESISVFYALTGSAKTVLRYYTEYLPKNGWKVELSGRTEAGLSSLFCQRSEAWCWLSIDDSALSIIYYKTRREK